MLNVGFLHEMGYFHCYIDIFTSGNDLFTFPNTASQFNMHAAGHWDKVPGCSTCMNVFSVMTWAYQQRVIIAWLQEKSQHVVLQKSTNCRQHVEARKKRQGQEWPEDILYLQYFHEVKPVSVGQKNAKQTV